MIIECSIATRARIGPRLAVSRLYRAWKYVPLALVDAMAAMPKAPLRGELPGLV